MTNFDDFFNVKPVVQEAQQSQITEFRPSPKKGQNGVFQAVVRFLPNPVDPGNKSIISKYCVYLKEPGNPLNTVCVDCPSTIGQPDPLQTTFFNLRNSANPVLKENAALFSRKQQFASLVQVIDCKSDPSLTNKILVWKYGIKIHEKIVTEMNPPMGAPKNPFNLITGRPFAVKVTEVSGYPNYDSCGFFDLDVSQSGMRINVNNQQYIVTPDVISTPQGKEMVFNYLKDNAPDTSKYEYQPWTQEQSEFVNRCILVYSDPSATLQAAQATAMPGIAPVQQQPAFAQAAAQPMVQPQMPTMGMHTGNQQPFAPQASAMPTMPSMSEGFEMPGVPSMGLDVNSVASTDPRGFNQTAPLNSDIDSLINGAQQQQASAPTMGMDLSDVLNGQF